MLDIKEELEICLLKRRLSMRKVIGIGETIMDIVLKNGQPVAAVPGGSVFNGIISLGRLGTNVTVISETGNDRVGREILKFMEDNGVDSSNVNVYEDGRTAISLAWLNEKNDAEYDFYKDYPKARLNVEWPVIEKDDIIMMSSYFVLNPALRTKVREFLTYAREKGALIVDCHSERNLWLVGPVEIAPCRHAKPDFLRGPEILHRIPGFVCLVYGLDAVKPACLELGESFAQEARIVLPVPRMRHDRDSSGGMYYIEGFA